MVGPLIGVAAGKLLLHLHGQPGPGAGVGAAPAAATLSSVQTAALGGGAAAAAVVLLVACHVVAVAMLLITVRGVVACGVRVGMMHLDDANLKMIVFTGMCRTGRHMGERLVFSMAVDPQSFFADPSVFSMRIRIQQRFKCGSGSCLTKFV